MAWVFIQLKLCLYRNLLRSSTTNLVGFIISALIGLQVMVGGFIALAGLRWVDDFSVTRWEIASCIFAVITLMWVLGPLAASGYDNTLRTDVLVLFPLRTRDIVLGQPGGSLLGIAASSAAVALCGSLIGLTASPLSVLFAAPVVLSYIGFNIVAARAMGITLTGLLRSRRGRELGTGIVIIAASMGYVAVLLSSQITADFIRAAADWLRWTPPGWAVQSFAAAASGDYLLALAWLLALILLTALLARWWVHRLGRVLTAADSGTTRPISRRKTRTSNPSGRWSQLLARRPVLAIAAWNWRYTWRTPSRRIAVLVGIVAGIAVPLFLLSSVPDRGPGLVFLTCFTGWMLASPAANLFGYDGSARWQLLSGGVDSGTDLRGRNLMLAATAAMAILCCAIALASLSGGWALLPGALAIGGASFAIGLSSGNITSAFCPYPVPDNPSNPLASGRPSNMGLLVGLGMLTFGLQFLLCAPLVVLAVLSTTNPWWQAALILIALGLGYGSWRLSITLAGNRLRGREPELLAAVAGSG